MHTSKNQNQFFNNFRGKVVTHESNGYCRIFVPGIYPDDWEMKTIQNLPLAEPAQPLFAGGGNSNGMFQYPDIGTVVWLFFEYGDISRPIYFACTNNDKTKFVEGISTIRYKNSEISIVTTEADNKEYISIKSTDNVVIEVTGEKNKCSLLLDSGGSITIVGNVTATGNIVSNSAFTGVKNGISFKGGLAV